MKHTLLAIAAGIVSGILALAAASGASIAVAFLLLVLPLPLLYAGLSLGTQAALVASATAVVVTSLFSLKSGLAIGVLYAMPVWVMVRLALSGPHGVIRSVLEDGSPHTPEGPATQSTVSDRLIGRVETWEQDPGEPARDAGWFPAGYILTVLVGLGCTFIAVASLWSAGELEQHVTVAVTDLVNAIAGQQDESIRQQAIEAVVPYVPGIMLAEWALWLALNAVIAQGLLAKGGQNIRPSPRLRELTLPDGLSWALVGFAFLTLIASGEIEYIGRNLSIVLAVPFFFLGLGVVHKLAALMPFPGVMLALVYLMIVLTGWFILVIVGLGILEQWVGLKNRMKSPT